MNYLRTKNKKIFEDTFVTFLNLNKKMEGNPGFFLTKNEIRSMRDLLENKIRADCRSPTDIREFHCEFSDSASIIRLGSTIVSCKIVKTKVAADEDHPNQGFFSIGLSSSQKLDPNFRSETLNPIRDLIKKNNALDIESLVITMGKEVWDLRAEIVILENDGGLYESMTLAVLAALLATKLESPRGPKPLVMHHLPIPVTFAFIDQYLMYVDPTVIEASACNGFMTIFANGQGDICAIHKSGGVSVNSTTMINCIDLALDISKSLHKSLLDQMGDDAPPLLKKLTEKYGQEEEKEVIDINEEDSKDIEESTYKDVMDAFNENEKKEEADEGPTDFEGLMAFVN